MLRAVPSTKEAWEPRPDETENEHLAFLVWMHSAKPRKAPPDALATKHEWGARARAFDKGVSAPRSTKDRIANATRALCVIAHLEAEKLLKKVEGTDGEVLTVKEQITLMAYLTGMTNLSDLITEKDEIDVKKLTTEQIRQIHDARKMLSSAARH